MFRSILRISSLVICTIALTAFAQQPATSNSSPDQEAIQQLEADLLKAEMSGDPTPISRILADDWVNLPPTGTGSSKATIVGRYRRAAGEAPPYAAKEEDMRIYLLNETAVAAYVGLFLLQKTPCPEAVSRRSRPHCLHCSFLFSFKLDKQSPEAEADAAGMLTARL
jgi:hypothetical protein